MKTYSLDCIFAFNFRPVWAATTDVSQLDFKLQIFALGMLHVPTLVHLHLQVE